MSEWAWYYSQNEERYEGPEKNREDAIQAATDSECGFCEHEDGSMDCVFHIMEARKVPLRLDSYFDADEWFEKLDDHLYDLSNQDGGSGLFEGISKEATADLQERVRAAIAAWHEAGNTIVPWAFTESRNEETVRVPIRNPD
jgi:hypothetical protein